MIALGHEEGMQSAARPDGEPAEGRGQKRCRGADCTDVPEVVAVDDSNWPTWLSEAYEFLIMKNYGPIFKRAVQWWAALERVYGLENTVSMTSAVWPFAAHAYV